MPEKRTPLRDCLVVTVSASHVIGCPGLLSSVAWSSMPKKHTNGLIKRKMYWTVNSHTYVDQHFPNISTYSWQDVENTLRYVRISSKQIKEIALLHVWSLRQFIHTLSTVL